MQISLILFFRNRENDFAQYQQGVLSEADWQRYITSLTYLLGTERIRNFWINYGRRRFEREFVVIVNDIVEKTPVVQGQVQDRYRSFFESPEEYQRQLESLTRGSYQ